MNAWPIAALCWGALVPPPPLDGPPTGDVYCGSYSLYIAMRSLGLELVTYEQVEKKLGDPTSQGYSMKQLEDVARSFSFQTAAVRTTLDRLERRRERLACLTTIRPGHYGLLYDADQRTVYLCDAPDLVEVPRETFTAAWGGEALLIGPAPFESEESLGARLAGRSTYIRVGSALALGLLGLAAVVAWLRRTRRRAVSALLLVLGAAWHPAGCKPGISGAAVDPTGVEAVPATRDLGTIEVLSPDTTAVGTVELVNRGTQPFRIARLIPSCRCTDVDIDRTVIPPGGRATLEATIRLIENDDDGETRVVIQSEDPRAPEAAARFRWRARNALHAASRCVELPTVRPGEAHEARIGVSLGAMGLCPECEVLVTDDLVELEEFVPPGCSTRAGRARGAPPTWDEPLGELAVRAGASGVPAHRQGTLAVKLVCGMDERARLRLPVSWRVAAPVVVQPEALYLGAGPPGSAASSELILASVDGSPITVTRVACSDDSRLIRAKFDPAATPTKVVQLEFETPAAGLWEAELRLEYGGREPGYLVLPVTRLVDPPNGPPTTGRVEGPGP